MTLNLARQETREKTRAEILAGLTDGSPVPVGQIGEELSASGGGINASSTPQTVAFLPLTPGSWDIRGALVFSGFGAVTGFQFNRTAISLTSASIDPAADVLLGAVSDWYGVPSGFTVTSPRLPPVFRKLKVTVNTTVYLVAQSSATGQGGAVWGGALLAVRVP